MVFPPGYSMTFDDWVDYVFDHPVADDDEEKWFLKIDEFGLVFEEGLGDEPEVRLAEYVARLFEYPGILAKRFSLDQIAQGIECLMLKERIFYNISRECVPVSLQKRCIAAIYVLYRDMFCAELPKGPTFEDGERVYASELEWECFYFWEADWGYNLALEPSHSVLAESVFDVLGRILLLDSYVCQESAIHALGHMRKRNNVDARQMLEVFRKTRLGVPSELDLYAEKAMEGRIV